MGLFGTVALAVNLAAASILIPHRAGGTKVRALWLFSRNGAIGSLAIGVAAGLVWRIGTAWPGLAVATVIAGLILQPAWSIARNARANLREAGRSGQHRIGRAAGRSRLAR
jgi:Co/Zn/Cd efflux system component